VAAGERDRPDVARRRAQWIKYQNRIDPERLVFVDETWTKTNMAPLRGWGPRGRRVKAKLPHGRWNTTTFLAALRHDRIDAPWLLEGPIDGEAFQIYVEKVLIPTLRPGDIVIIDNAAAQRYRMTWGQMMAPRAGTRVPHVGACAHRRATISVSGFDKLPGWESWKRLVSTTRITLLLEK
jgi:hypothetical protein